MYYRTSSENCKWWFIICTYVMYQCNQCCWKQCTARELNIYTSTSIIIYNIIILARVSLKWKYGWVIPDKESTRCSLLCLPLLNKEIKFDRRRKFIYTYVIIILWCICLFIHLNLGYLFIYLYHSFFTLINNN